MKTNDMNRREFIKTGSGAAAGAAAATSGVVSLSFSVNAWAGSLKVLNDHEAKTVLYATRQIFPHPSLADEYYAGVVNALDAEAAGDEAAAKVLKDGVAALDKETDVAWTDLSDGYQLEILTAMESSAFFQKVKGKAVVALYNNPLVWRHFGYEGASAQFGGYIDRGFDDIRWLEQPPKDASPDKR